MRFYECYMIIYKWYVIVNTPQAGLYEYNARVCNHKYIQHEGEARGLYVLVVTHG